MKEWNAIEICQQLLCTITDYSRELTVLSVFSSSINIIGEDLFFSIVTDRHCLYPMSCRIKERTTLTEVGIRTGMSIIISGDRIYFPQADLTINLLSSKSKDLSISQLEDLIIPMDLDEKVTVLIELVRDKGCKDDLSTLVTGKYHNPYAEAVTEYLPEFGRAIREGDKRTAELVGAFAGGGIGLTPSSDDLLVGYMTVYLAQTVAVDRSHLEEALRLTKAIGEEAAEHTNLISGAFLKQCGKGLLSENMTELVIALYSDSNKETIQLCGERIIMQGSTSGTDMLTGVILSLMHLNDV